MLNPYLYLDKTAHSGRGVFTKERIPKGTIVEISPVIVMNNDDRILLDQTKLHDYIFEWGPNKDLCCMALGLIPMYNHHYKSNCEYFMDFDEQTMLIKTVKAIDKGAELTINYNGDWNDEARIWFDAK